MKKLTYALLTCTLLLPVAAQAETTNAPLPAYSDGAPVVLTGTVNEVRKDEFDLSYGAGAVTVELDGWNWSGNETKYLNPGDEVTVSGRIDDDLFEGREIEADNIFIRSSSTYYYTNDSYPSYYMTYDRGNRFTDGAYVSMRGKVSDISGDEFTLVGVGPSKANVKVDTSKLGYNPFDDEGVRIKAGDTIQVYGQIDDSLFESREVMANNIIIMSQVGAPANP